MDIKKQKRLSQLQKQHVWLQKIENQLLQKDKRFFWYRLASFGAAWIGAILIRFLIPGGYWVAVFLFFMFVFLVVVLFHRKLDRVRNRYQNTRQWVNDQISRLSLDWSQISPSLHFKSVETVHPFASDLNLFGPKSLFQLLDCTVSLGGSQRLHDWLLFPKLDALQIQKRQQQVNEMISLPGFRRAYQAINNDPEMDANTRWDDRTLLNWLNQGTDKPSFNVWLLGLSGLAIINLTLFILATQGLMNPFWQFGLILYAAIYLFKYQEYKSLFEEAFTLNQSLQTIKSTFKLLETYPYPASDHLREIVSGFTRAGSQPSKILRKITWITSAASLQNNQILWLVVNVLIPWDLWFAKILDSYKTQLTQLVPGWLDIWYEIDALASLANFAYLNPEYHFPDVLDADSSLNYPIIQASELGHPLISADNKVTNAFNVNEMGEIALITGSNMSGKSTFLRTMGVNLVLAYAGAPVNATQMKLVLLRLFTCIQVSDSLADGFSYFYAEVRRLKSLLDLASDGQKHPVFYLIDEIFRGTNNQERRIGSQSYVRKLAKSSACGMISTHDLELAKLGNENNHILNYHFRDDVVNDRMVFDYKLRSGPSPSTNALKIMKNEGLPVEEI
ncbi:MAG: MutS family DNA mismatch repair protein [Anaerolineaceae bacterium]